MKFEHPYLEATKPDGAEFTIDLEKTILSQNSEEIYIAIGRQNNNHIVLSDPQKKISRHHCSLQYKNNRWWIVDKGSANGTFLQRKIDQSEIDVRGEDAISLRSGNYILILGEITLEDEHKFWRLQFIDPGQTNLVSDMQDIHSIEYNFSQQTLFRIIARQRDPVSLGEQELSLIDYMSRKNYDNNLQAAICNYDELIQVVWNDKNFGIEKKNINHLVWRIRHKIETDAGEPKFLKTIKGRGYTLSIKVVE